MFSSFLRYGSAIGVQGGESRWQPNSCMELCRTILTIYPHTWPIHIRYQRQLVWTRLLTIIWFKVLVFIIPRNLYTSHLQQMHTVNFARLFVQFAFFVNMKLQSKETNQEVIAFALKAFNYFHFIEILVSQRIFPVRQTVNVLLCF